MKILKVPAFGIVITYGRGKASITSDLKADMNPETDDEFNDDQLYGAMEAIESMVLAHFHAGIDVCSTAYLVGLETAVESCHNKLG